MNNFVGILANNNITDDQTLMAIKVVAVVCVTPYSL